MEFEKIFEDFLMEVKTYGTWSRHEYACNYLYRFYDIAITFAPNVPLRKAFEALLCNRDDLGCSFSACETRAEKPELDRRFMHELYKTLKYLASINFTEKPAA